MKYENENLSNYQGPDYFIYQTPVLIKCNRLSSCCISQPPILVSTSASTPTASSVYYPQCIRIIPNMIGSLPIHLFMISDLAYTSQVSMHLLNVRSRLMYSLLGLGSTGLPTRGLHHLVNALTFIVDKADVRTKEKS